MSLLHCLACGDIQRLTSDQRSCRCARSRGRMDRGQPWIHGPARVVELVDDAGFVPGDAPEGRWFVAREESRVQRIPVPPLL
jgi:hypothetical protein